MSTRTIIEINHDYLHDLDNPETLQKLLQALRSGDISRYIESTMHIVPGIRVLAMRHHTETITLKIV